MTNKAPTMLSTDTTSVEGFEENLELNMKFLKENYLELPTAKDVEFAKSLCSWYDRYEELSSKQMYRAMQFFSAVKELTGKEPGYSRGNVVQLRTKDAPPVQSQPIRVPVDAEKALILIAKFDNAVEGIKYPSIVVPVENINLVEASGAKITGISFYRMVKIPGAVGITNNKKGAGFRALAIIQRTGIVEWTQANITGDLAIHIKLLIEDLVNQVAIAGKRVCTCCFCGRGLENKISVYHGYGPICAEKWMLPWEGEPKYDLELL